MAQSDPGLKIIEIKAYPTSFPVKPEDSISLGIGRVVKRDAVIVKVTTAGATANRITGARRERSRTSSTRRSGNSCWA